MGAPTEPVLLPHASPCPAPWNCVCVCVCVCMQRGGWGVNPFRAVYIFEAIKGAKFPLIMGGALGESLRFGLKIFCQ